MTSLDDLMKSTIAQLKGIAKLRGLSQERWGAACGRTQSSVGGMLAGRWKDMKLSSIVALASAANADVEVRIVPRGEDWPCPLTDNGERAIFRCQSGLWSAQGPSGEIQLDWQAHGAVGRRWRLWMGQGGTFGETVSFHVRSCHGCRMTTVIEYV